jgi:nucleoside-diphosphate-sugar epimerase
MRIVMIGGSGHIGTYLVPMLVERGHEVMNITRGESQPYLPNAAWNSVQSIKADRAAEDAAGTFGQRVRDLKPDVVVDLICFTEDSARQIVAALRGQVQHFLHCGTIWIYGHSMQVPAREDQPRRPFGSYGIQKAAIEAYLLDEARRSGFPATMLHAGHIVGPGYLPLNPQGNFNPEVYIKLARGERLTLANLGLETVHHVHAVDVAQAFLHSINHWSASVGESFHAVSPAAITLRGYAEAVAAWFGQEAKLDYLGWEEWRKTVSEKDANTTWDHIAHSPNASIDKARRLINYQPRYSSLEAIREALDWQIANKVITI